MAIKYTIEYIKMFIEREGYKLNTEIYEGAHIKMEVICPKSHIFLISWTNFQQGRRCPVCKTDKMRLSYNYVKEQIEKEGFKLLSKKYMDNETKLKMRCPNGHELLMRYNNFHQGNRCQKCSYYEKRHTIEYVREKMKKEEFELLSNEYKNNTTRLKVRCPKGHEIETVWANFNNGTRCAKCHIHSSGSSLGEQEVLKHVKYITNISIIKNDRTQITNPLTKCNLELDIWIPSMNKAIEYNGTYWHSLPRRKMIDGIKRNQCRMKGIDLMVIKEEDWKRNKDKMIIDINHFIKGEL